MSAAVGWPSFGRMIETLAGRSRYYDKESEPRDQKGAIVLHMCRLRPTLAFIRARYWAYGTIVGAGTAWRHR